MFLWSLWQVPWWAHFLNWTSANSVLFFEGMTGRGQWRHWGRGKKRGVRESGSWQGRGCEPQSKPADPTRLLSAPPEKSCSWARLAQFSEKDHSNSLRKSHMQSTFNFWVKPQQLNETPKKWEETATNAGPQVPVMAIGCYKTQKGWWESIVNAFKNTDVS